MRGASMEETAAKRLASPLRTHAFKARRHREGFSCRRRGTASAPAGKPGKRCRMAPFTSIDAQKHRKAPP